MPTTSNTRRNAIHKLHPNKVWELFLLGRIQIQLMIFEDQQLLLAVIYYCIKTFSCKLETSKV